MVGLTLPMLDAPEQKTLFAVVHCVRVSAFLKWPSPETTVLSVLKMCL